MGFVLVSHFGIKIILRGSMATKSPNIRLYSTDRKIYFTSARELGHYYGVSNNCANLWVARKVIPINNGTEFNAIYEYKIPREFIHEYENKIYKPMGEK